MSSFGGENQHDDAGQNDGVEFPVEVVREEEDFGDHYEEREEKDAVSTGKYFPVAKSALADFVPPARFGGDAAMGGAGMGSAFEGTLPGSPDASSKWSKVGMERRDKGPSRGGPASSSKLRGCLQ